MNEVYVYDSSKGVLRQKAWIAKPIEGDYYRGARDRSGEEQEIFEEAFFNSDMQQYELHLASLKEYPCNWLTKEDHGRELKMWEDFKVSIPVGAKVKCLFKDSAHGFWIRRGDVLTVRGRVDTEKGIPNKLKFREIKEDTDFYENDFEIVEGFLIAVPIPKEAPVEDQEAIEHWRKVYNHALNLTWRQYIAEVSDKYQIIKRNQP